MIKGWIKPQFMSQLLMPEIGLTFENFPWLKRGCTSRRYYELTVRLTGQRIAPETIRSLTNPKENYANPSK
jgi:hypothetical protein